MPSYFGGHLLNIPFLSLYQNNISSYQTIIIKHANKSSVDLIKFSISNLEIYKPRLEIYIFKLKI